MKRTIAIACAALIALIVIAMHPTEPMAQAQSPGSCTSEHAKCVKVCDDQSKRRDASGCYSDCTGRMGSCRQSGCYYWRLSSPVCGLTRK